MCLQPPLSFKTRALFYPTVDHALNIEAQIEEFVSSLFWVLEYKRMDRRQEKSDKPTLLCAPFEKKVGFGSMDWPKLGPPGTTFFQR